MAILEELFQGNINPSEKTIKENSDYQKQNKHLLMLIDKLTPMLNKDEKRFLKILATLCFQ